MSKIPNDIKNRIKLAKPLISSSVTDALHSLKELGFPDFQDADGTINFIQNVHSLVSTANSKSKFGKGFNEPFSVSNLTSRRHSFETICQYLSGLTDAKNISLFSHQEHQNFIRGLMVTSQSLFQVANKLITREEDPYDYFQTSKASLESLETLFRYKFHFHFSKNF